MINFSRNFINFELIDSQVGTLRLTGFYGFPESSLRRESWNLLRNLSNNVNHPWCVIGDFNNILSSDDKGSRVPRPSWLINGFRDVVSSCNLIDIPLIGYPFTWEKSKGKLDAVEERLDMALVSESWIQCFPNSKLLNLIAPMSNNSPILLSPDDPPPRSYIHRFKFENVWLQEPNISEVVASGWSLPGAEGIT